MKGRKKVVFVLSQTCGVTVSYFRHLYCYYNATVCFKF